MLAVLQYGCASRVDLGPLATIPSRLLIDTEHRILEGRARRARINMQDTLLVELLTEELPPKALARLGEAFADGIVKGLVAHKLVGAAPEFHTFASPRRLAVTVSGVAAQAADAQVREKIMPVSVALTADGTPSPALLKKLEAKGISADAVAGFERAIRFAHLLPLPASAGQCHQQRQQHPHARRTVLMPETHEHATRAVCSTHRAGRRMGKRRLACGTQPLCRIRRKRRPVQLPGQFSCKFAFVHDSTPFARSQSASACVAREQCVLTLPSEHPISRAVSATSISSQ